MSNSAFTPTVLTIPATGGGGTGQGELSLITNGSAVTDITGWTNVTRVTSNSPLNPLVPTAFSISNAAGAESSTSGGYASFTLPTGLQNRKLKVEFYYTTPATDVYRVSVYRGSTRVALSTDSSGPTTLPANTTGKFVAYFDTDASASWSLNVTRTSGTTGPCYITNVVCGPGIQPQGAVVGEWQSYSVAPTGGGSATFTYVNRQYRRVGDSVEVYYVFSVGTAGSGATAVTIPLPPNLNIDYTKAANETRLGSYSFLTTNYTAGGSARSVTGVPTGIQLQEVGATTLITGADLTAGSAWYVSFTAPIAEWAGSGTVQLAQNDVEYAWNNNSGTTAGAVYSSSANFGYGPGGTPIPAINSTTTTGESKTFYDVQFQTPIQAGDQIVLEMYDGNGWFNSAQRLPPLTFNAASYGGILTVLSSTTVRVGFGNAGYAPAGAASYGAAGGAWSAVTSWRWRVRKSSAGAAVGFGIVSPGTSAGLVSAAGLPGNTTGNAIASGYVGEFTETSVGPQAAAASNTPFNVGFVDIPAGRWKVEAVGSFAVGTVAGNTGFVFDLNTTSATLRTGRFVLGTTLSAAQNGGLSTYSLDINVASTTRVYLVGQYNFTSVGTSTMSGYIKYTRIA